MPQTTTLVVTTTADSGEGSLRECILRANAVGDGDVKIFFKISGQSLQIRPLSPLPAISRSMRIDGRSQPGWRSHPVIELDGSAAGVSYGMRVHKAEGCTLAGLAICGFRGNGLELLHSGSHRILNCYFGLDPDGTVAKPNELVGCALVGCANSIIGGLTASERCIASGNTLYGIQISGPLSAHNRLVGNFVGTDAAGTTPIPNGRTGILVFNSPFTIIGGVKPGEGNLVSGNRRGGINIDGSAVRTHVQQDWEHLRGPNRAPHSADGVGGKGECHGTIVQGNLIGTDITGKRGLANGLHGLLLYESQHSTIGGAQPGGANLISGNGRDGILMLGNEAEGELDCTGNVIVGNRIGIDIDGREPLPNRRAGVFISKAASNCVGGPNLAEGNVISGNETHGVCIFGETASGNRILGNLIGTDATGMLAIGNRIDGIMVRDAPVTVLGGSEPGSRNMIEHNGRHGIFLMGDWRDCAVLSNTVRHNRGSGMLVSEIKDVTTRLENLRKENCISGNRRDDIRVLGPDEISGVRPRPRAAVGRLNDRG